MSKALNPITTPRHNTLAAQAQARIREAIVTRELKPGQRIEQNKLAEELQVSLVPIREALKGLEAEGLVSIIPHRGAFVTEVSLEHLDDLYYARAMLEGLVAGEAVPHLSAADFSALESLMMQMEAATEAKDISHFMALNRVFHMRIYEALGNQHLMQIILGLWERSELYRYRYMFVIHNADQVHAEHRALVEALRAQDKEAVRAVVAQHIRTTQDGLHRELSAELQENELKASEIKENEA